MIYYNKPLDDSSIEILKLIEEAISFDWLTISEIQNRTWINHPQKLYNRLQKLIREWYITEDFELLKMPETKEVFLPFFWWAQCWNNGNKVFGEYPRERIKISLDTNPKLIGNYKDFFITRAKWKSMEPDIKSWDNLLVKKYDNSWNFWNKIFLLKHNEKAKIKKLIKWNSSSVILKSLNEDYPDLEIDLQKDDFQIVWSVEQIWFLLN